MVTTALLQHSCCMTVFARFVIEWLISCFAMAGMIDFDSRLFRANSHRASCDVMVLIRRTLTRSLCSVTLGSRMSASLSDRKRRFGRSGSWDDHGDSWQLPG